LNSPGVVSKKWRYRYDIGHNNKILSILCHVVYATKGFIRSDHRFTSVNILTAAAHLTRGHSYPGANRNNKTPLSSAKIG
jgi:hypothetical protein